ncbi:fused response regulator/phosphatase [Motilimonas cestriensis]|uniref:Fused response regulator/phosphatase n=1 Tax=Motilimonas cestriensis TaxID=2742685 RepID=A0ABS8WHQ6_9GAMM|nr:fused response regulator/phosphatase [Motilimonas cestriensis]MCE2596900.1 fused response regulator/phosphatase [Motilimonas cestriensis]
MPFSNPSLNISPPYSVLVVEDSTVFTLMYQHFLKEKGVVTTTCLTLEDASNVISRPQQHFDVILLDNHLTDGEGVTLLPMIKEQLKATAVIMVSANDDADFFLRAFNQGIDDYALKPVNMDLLWLKMKKSVHQRRLEKLNNEQREALNQWRDAELQEQALARHLIGAMFAKIRSDVDAIHYWVKPSSQFSGDSVINCQGVDGSDYVMLADAMGHGLTAAVSLMPVVPIFKAMAEKALPLSNIVFEINSKLTRLLPQDRFVAVIILHIQPASKIIDIWNGSMPPVLVLDENGQLVKQLDSDNMALGILPDTLFSVHPERIELRDNQRIIMFSDGVIETLSNNGELLSQEALIPLLNMPGNPLDGVKKYFNVDCPPASDDISIVQINTHNIIQSPKANRSIPIEQQSGFLIEHTLCGAALELLDIPGHFSDLLARQLPLPLVQKVFTVLTELYMNAFEHGVLGLSSEVKSQENGFLTFYEQKEQRVKALTIEHKVELKVQWQSALSRLDIYIKDSGHGFLHGDIKDTDLSKSYGRGLRLIEHLADSLEIIAPGNAIRVVLVGSN